MAFVTDLTDLQKDILYSALYNYILGIPDLPIFIPTPTRLTPSMNTSAEENVRSRLNDLLTANNIVESPGTMSLFSISRNDRYFFIRYNDCVYRISTNSDLSEIYDVDRF